MKKKAFVLLMVFVAALSMLTGCHKEFGSKDYWVGNYSETFTRDYKKCNGNGYDEEEMKEFSPTGTRFVKYNVILVLEENGDAYFSRRIVDSRNKICDLEGDGTWDIAGAKYNDRHNYAIYDEEIKYIIFFCFDSTNKIKFAVTKKGSLYMVDTHRSLGDEFYYQEMVKIF